LEIRVKARQCPTGLGAAGKAANLSDRLVRLSNRIGPGARISFCRMWEEASRCPQTTTSLAPAVVSWKENRDERAGVASGTQLA
jgi:hypothetical protein